MDKFKIDEVAKESGLTKRTIRYYEEIGLLSPPERSKGGMRLYTREHIEHLKQIVNAREVLGFTLQEIQEFVAIREELMNRRDAYVQMEDAEQKRLQLLEVKRNVDSQMQLIEQKIEKLNEFQQQLKGIQKRVSDALELYTPREGE